MDVDHRDLNRTMKLYSTSPLAGSGLPLWLPAGSAIRSELQKLAADLARNDGCIGVHSPVLGKRELFERSGHLAKFADDMFPPMRLGGDDVMLRPANCPHHALIYAAERHSYRELPLRLNELASMFRAERSGVVSGLTRVREIHLDDTHVFCRPDQVADEVARALRAALEAQAILGLPVDDIRLSLRDDSDAWLGTAEQWNDAQNALREGATRVLASRGAVLVEAPGEAAFYGPKLDLQFRNDAGHEETIATVQLDFNQPERFDLTFVDDRGEDSRVVMIHRGTVGSMERVTAALLEHHKGRLPFWIAPMQLAVIPISDRHDLAARALADSAASAGLRARVAYDGSLGARIRDARDRRDSVFTVIGDDEIADGTVTVTDVAAGYRGRVPLHDLVERARLAHQRRDTHVHWPS
ncbi:threonine--tRNA ligase [Paramicrobacterium chengjingii]|uniref:Threonine--tRNA ligase n=1 Tax=Paramicrobacterium chengjingii TaxID=2769067 RepID=A0ABX6YJ20_9MICO|nr:threonine--tRNA ligase [Microbacterium chengjingii]QPZ38788.1 threonine--tRNA ligase [Microbacterium chengjingii]